MDKLTGSVSVSLADNVSGDTLFKTDLSGSIEVHLEKVNAPLSKR